MKFWVEIMFLFIRYVIHAFLSSPSLNHTGLFVCVCAAKLRESCFDPGVVLNGTRLGSDYKLGSTVTFYCEAGYVLQVGLDACADEWIMDEYNI